MKSASTGHLSLEFKDDEKFEPKKKSKKKKIFPSASQLLNRYQTTSNKSQIDCLKYERKSLDLSKKKC